MDILTGLYKEFSWFIWGLVGLGVIWFFTGGPQRDDAHRGAYIKPLAPLDTGETYGGYYEGSAAKRKQTLDLPEAPADIIRRAESVVESFVAQSQEAQDIHVASLLAKRISLDGVAGARAKDPDEEYLRILASEFAKEPIAVSGLLLRGNTYGIGALVPKASELPLLGTTAVKSDVVLPPGGRALIASGRSPIGSSFRVNICSGYLEQFQDYTPDLRKDCPSPSDELERIGPKGDEACAQFVKALPRCRVYQGALPKGLSADCRAFVSEKLAYNGCALEHKGDKGFYQDEWRLFLDQTEELWRDKNEIVKLIDAKGKTVDAIAY